jgi:hypothetical protein
LVEVHGRVAAPPSGGAVTQGFRFRSAAIHLSSCDGGSEITSMMHCAPSRNARAMDYHC